uniref:Outer membrane protein beta-barrel domain-containing protein n=1 Tax=candidate division WOR-3 bacterium TaxID=2052148 RepID=A0A7V0Z520_UNCW3
MKRLIILISLPMAFIRAQTELPVKTFFGLQTGMNHSTFDPDDGAGNFSGLGFQIGLGMGVEFANIFGIQIAPTFKTTSFDRTVLNVDMGADYNNLYLPFTLQLKAGMLPVAPYLGLGFAGNFQLDGTAYLGSLKTSVDDLENDLLFLFSVGTDFKLTKVNLTPEFSFNFNLTADDPDTQNCVESNYGFDISLGVYYTP